MRSSRAGFPCGEASREGEGPLSLPLAHLTSALQSRAHVPSGAAHAGAGPRRCEKDSGKTGGALTREPE